VPTYGQEQFPEKIFHIQAETFSTPPVPCAPREKSTFLPQVPKVNLVTGEYCEEACDLVVAGSEPLSLRRFYNHFSGMYERMYGHWRINPETLMLFNFEQVGDSKVFVGSGEKNGAFYLHDIAKGNSFEINPSTQGFAADQLSGKRHPLNSIVSFTKGHRVIKSRQHDPENHYWWEGAIKDGSGGERLFKTDLRQWPQQGKSQPCRRRRHPASGEVQMTKLIFTPPYQAQILEEHRPNGNVIRYGYADYVAFLYKNFSEFSTSELPSTYVLKSIQAFSATGLLLGSIEIEYTGHIPAGSDRELLLMDGVFITGSDGRKAVFGQPQRVLKKFVSFDTTLHSVEAAGKPTFFYDYYNNRTKQGDTYAFPPFLYQMSQKEGCYFETTYSNDAWRKVVAQSAPVGPNGEKCPIARYVYDTDATTVFDGENNKMIYRFSAEKRVIAVEKYQGETLYSIERSVWDAQTGNLLDRKIEDASGTSFFHTSYLYDKHHNVIEEKIDGASPILRTYSDDGFNNKLTESDRAGNLVEYHYLPGTNLLIAELVKLEGAIAKRTFHVYDLGVGAVCIKTIIDDGTSEDPNDVQGVSYRHVTEITPKRTLPCIGFPEEIREYAGDQLLKKIRYTYHPSGKIASEEHFDANNQHSYTLYNHYDKEERLIATNDALGNQTTFTYDNNFNCTSQHGPRPDQHKEWRYDLANRPIQELEWQSDGTILITEHKYDKNSRVVATIDPSGFETHYTYDALGRLIATHYPDGAVERRGYDVLGNVIQEIDVNGYITKKACNFRGQPTAIEHPDGTQEHFTYNESGGTLACHLDRHGVETRYTYDLLDRPIRTETQIAVITAAYSPYHLISETDALGITTFLTYDLAGRKIGERKENKETNFSYNALGQLAQINEGDVATTFFYDLKGQLLEKKIADVFQENYTYDEAGNRTSIRTCAGTCFTVYNSRGEPIQIIDPLENTTEFSYSYQDGFKKEVRDPKGITKVTLHDSRKRPIDLQTKNLAGELIQRTEKVYDLVGNQIQQIEHIYQNSQLQKTISHTWRYGPGGRLESLIEAGEKETSYVYDSLGRLSVLIKPDGRSIHRTYDVLSRLAHFYGEGIDYTYIYDAKNRLIQIDDALHHTRLESSYDVYDHLIKEKLDSGITLRKEFDPYGRCTALHLPGGGKVDYAYKGPYIHKVSYKGLSHTYNERNLSGRPKRITLANASTLTLEWDPLLRWKAYRSPHFSASYLYDVVGNLIHYTFHDSLGEEENNYTYDELNQLISENDHAYTYDSLHSRRSKDQNAYTLNALQQVLSDGSSAYSYDKNGNLIADGQRTYEYDLLDRLIVVKEAGKRTVYAYDALNRRISKNKDIYIWNGQQEIGMVRDGKVKELRILGEGKGAEIGAAVLLELGGVVYVPIHDHRGSLVTLLSLKNIPFHTQRYTAFGECPIPRTPWAFASKRFDPETGLIYFGKRYYCPTLGRWMTPDPQGFQDGPNLYAYVYNNPLLYCDPYGLLAQKMSDVHGAGDLLGYAWHHTCRAVEWIGHNLMPPFAREFMEGVGRGARGESWRAHRELAHKESSTGTQLPHMTHTYHNGIMTSLASAIEKRDEISKNYGGVIVDLLYNPSQGFFYDMIHSVIAKCGIKTSYEHMCAEYYTSIFAQDAQHQFIAIAHSQGATRLNNVSHMLEWDQCQRISVDTYGAATIINDERFKNVHNFVSKLDFVPCTSVWRYAKNVCGFDSNITFLTPTSRNPLTEHYLMNNTYNGTLLRRGLEFQKEYLHE